MPEDDEVPSDLEMLEDVDEEAQPDDNDLSIDEPEIPEEATDEEAEPEPEPEEQDIDEVDIGVSVKALEKAFPEITKKFPTLKSTLWREQKFTEVFPTIEHAYDAYKNAQAFTNFESEILSGQAGNLLKNVQQVDPRAFQKFTTNFLPSLQKLDGEAFNNVVGPVVLRVIQNVYNTGAQHNNNDLMLSAQHISKLLFGNPNVDQVRPPEPQKSEPDEQEQRVKNEREKFFSERKKIVLNEVVEQTDTILNREIEKTLGEDFNEFTRSALSDKILKRVNEVLVSDERHMNAMRSMWDKAERSGFTVEWRNKIRAYYLARARAVLPLIRSKAKAEAGKRPKAVASTRMVPGGRSPAGGNSNKVISSKQIDYSKTSDLDILNGRISRKQ